MKIKIKIRGGCPEDQRKARDALSIAMMNLRRRQAHEGKEKAEYKIETACRGSRSAGWKN